MCKGRPEELLSQRGVSGPAVGGVVAIEVGGMELGLCPRSTRPEWVILIRPPAPAAGLNGLDVPDLPRHGELQAEPAGILVDPLDNGGGSELQGLPFHARSAALPLSWLEWPGRATMRPDLSEA